MLATDAAAVAARPETLLEECFGPVTLLVRYDDEAELLARARGGARKPHRDAAQRAGDEVDAVLAVLQRKAGRVLFAGWPTGVAVTWSQQHGGPWPATTSLHTSVGATAIRRFLRPIVFQDAPRLCFPRCCATTRSRRCRTAATACSFCLDPLPPSRERYSHWRARPTVRSQSPL